MTALLTKIEVPLQVPVTIKAADGKDAQRSALTLRRPKVRHTKRLAVLIGQDLVDILTGKPGEKIDGLELGKTIVARIIKAESLEGLTELIADLCQEEPAVIDDIDLIDIPALAFAFADFFPGLQSLMSSASEAISSSSANSTP